MNRLDFDYPFDLADTITALLGDIDDDYPVISVYYQNYSYYYSYYPPYI